MTLPEAELIELFFPTLEKDVSEYIRELLINAQSEQAKKESN